MKATDITSVGRPIDPRYPTNLAISLVALAVTVVGAVWQGIAGAECLDGILWGVQAGLTVFLTWALCRELDPDHPMGAFVAAGFGLLALVVWDLPQLGAIFWLLVLVRVVNRTTGIPAGLLDVLGLIGLAGWLSLQGNWGYSLITALALFLDSRLPDPARRQLIFALLAAVVTVVAAILGMDLARQAAPSLQAALIAMVLSLLFLPVLLAARRVESVGDQTGKSLIPMRVQAAQGLALLVGVEIALMGGWSGLQSLNPLWAAALGAAIAWLYNAVRP